MKTTVTQRVLILPNNLGTMLRTAWQPERFGHHRTGDVQTTVTRFLQRRLRSRNLSSPHFQGTA